ncbi:ylmG homolog protein 1-2, chloroplastic-like [Tasmannia lanceolata]|uniref:ylmG homolog protein 1-2, chloroplastic-like n=1 Tax=Tasmannia lanceolata TaxID=3420 RepID=UPI00406357CA
MAMVVASRITLFQNPNPKLSITRPNLRTALYLKRQTLTQQSLIPPLNFAVLRRTKLSTLIPKFTVSSLSTTPTISPNSTSTNSSTNLLSDSTRTVSTIFALAFSLSKLFLNTIQGLSTKIRVFNFNPTPEELAKIKTLKENVVCTVGPLFFAAIRDRPSGYLNTPLTVVAAGMSKWLDIYSGVLMVRVLLSWFPNIPWDRQPLSAIRDLCDPYLNLFRNIIPPIFDTLDVSPLLAFAVLGTLGSILNNSRGTY